MGLVRSFQHRTLQCDLLKILAAESTQETSFRTCEFDEAQNKVKTEAENDILGSKVDDIET